MGLTQAPASQRCRHPEHAFPRQLVPVYVLCSASQWVHLGFQPPPVLPQLLTLSGLTLE